MAAKVKKDECVACGTCIDVCPVEAITLNEIAEIDEEKCTECGACIDECPTDAIEL
jgi:ferredoxin